MPNNSWLGIGYGLKMNDVDMFSWQANGDSSFAIDSRGEGKFVPPKDPIENGVAETQCEFNKTTDRVKCTTMRKLDTGDPADFVIPLDEELKFAWVFNPDTY